MTFLVVQWVVMVFTLASKRRERAYAQINLCILGGGSHHKNQAGMLCVFFIAVHQWDRQRTPNRVFFCCVLRNNLQQTIGACTGLTTACLLFSII